MLIGGLAAAGAFAADEAANDDTRFHLGVDISSLNEMEKCGAVFRDSDKKPADALELLAEAGADLVRVRLWHSPRTAQGALPDVTRTFRRARTLGLDTLLDFHYSDDWAHPGQQVVPDAWRDMETVEALANRLHDYTLDTLTALADEDLFPSMVQVGNETNTEILMSTPDADGASIDWTRNARLLNAGIEAVREAGRREGASVEILLHVAQPENAAAWLDDAMAAGVHGFETLGLSYYSAWSTTSLDDLEASLVDLRERFGVPLMLLETGYPWTLESVDEASDLLGENALEPGYPATPEGQGRYLEALTRTVVRAGGEGLVYWEPAWVSTSCRTAWGQGSHWDNATLFDREGSLHEGAGFLGLTERRERARPAR